MNEADRQRHEHEYRAIAAEAWNSSRGEGEPEFAKLPNPDFSGQLVADTRAVLETGSAGPQRRAFQDAVKAAASRLANPAPEIAAESAGLGTDEGDAARAAAGSVPSLEGARVVGGNEPLGRLDDAPAVHADQLVSSVPQDGIDPALLHADTSNEVREPVLPTEQPATPAFNSDVDLNKEFSVEPGDGNVSTPIPPELKELFDRPLLPADGARDLPTLDSLNRADAPTPSDDARTLRNSDPADPSDDEAVSAAAQRLSARAHADEDYKAEATAGESPAV